MRVNKRDLISGAFCALGASALYVHAHSFPTRSDQAAAIGPVFYPKLLALMLGVLAAVQMVGAVSGSAPDGEARDTGLQVWKDRHAFFLFCLTLGLLVLYPFLIRLIGFAPSGFLFVGSLIYALSTDARRGRQLIPLALVTFAVTIVTYVVFRLVLNIPFPTGIIVR